MTDVAAIQRALLARGYDLGPAGADGDVGPRTIAAVMAFQRTAGLVADGIIGPHTRTAILDTFDPRDLKTPVGKPGWLVLAEAAIGTKEGAGASNNAEVIRMFADAGFPGIKTDSTAWCAAFVGAMLTRSGQKPSGSLAARSYEAWGVGLQKPALGCIVTKRRGSSVWQGHVFFCVGANKDSVFGLGGNQSDAVTVAVFRRAEVTAFRWPAAVPLPVSYDLPTTIAGAKAGVSEA